MIIKFAQGEREVCVKRSFSSFNYVLDEILAGFFYGLSFGQTHVLRAYNYMLSPKKVRTFIGSKKSSIKKGASIQFMELDRRNGEDGNSRHSGVNYNLVKDSVITLKFHEIHDEKSRSVKMYRPHFDMRGLQGRMNFRPDQNLAG